MAVSGIYKIESILRPDRVYIGSSVNISERWRIHLVGLRLAKHHSLKLQNHYNKYGECDLCFKIIEECDTLELIDREQYYIDSIKPYFNINPTAQSRLGARLSSEAIQKMKDYGARYVCSDETRQKMRVSNKPPSRLGLTSPMKGRKVSKESREKNSLSNIGRTPWNKGKKGIYSEETLKNMREIAIKNKNKPPVYKGKKIEETN